jgi:hypothetical protein
MLYSKSTGGFYDKRIHGKNIPTDALEISDDRYRELLDGQSTGKRITADDNGNPVLTDPPDPSREELAEQIRRERDVKLSASDWTILPDSPLTKQQQENWKAYRQALRDVPAQFGFPHSTKFPKEPKKS